MPRFLYTILLYLLIPYILLRLYWKGRRLPAYRQRIRERFSLDIPAAPGVDVWLHAVSLGEAVAAAPLIEALLDKQLSVLVTTMTPTGSAYITKRFADRISHQYVPYDFPWALKRFFKKINARIGIIMETELWPNLINQATRAELPLLLINARISDKAYDSYRKARFFFKPVLMQFQAIYAQSVLDAKRFISLGAPVDRVHVAGNMKFDIQVSVTNQACIKELKARWGKQRPVFIAASTHDDEESRILGCLPRLQAAIPDLLCLIAARHPERFNSVYELSRQQGFKTGLRSHPETIDKDTDVVVLDSLGELMGFYQVSHYAFVGGSLVPVGGHNVLEPIAMQVPVFCGPFMQNSKSVCADLCAAKAMQIVADANALAESVIRMHQDPALGVQQVQNATGVLEANRGSVARYLDLVCRYLA